MPFLKSTPLVALAALAALASIGALAAAGWVWSGVYDIGADDTHTRPVHAALTALRERSIQRHARGIGAPDLADPALIRQGAGNYAAMCTGCHLAPGMAPTELSRGLYPAPPNLSRTAVGDPAQRFWVIKHGIKASGMPAWGRSMGDPYVWGLVAFVQQLPSLDAGGYAALVASSGGHSHGGGETMPGAALPAGDGDHHGAGADHHAAAAAAAGAAPEHAEPRHAGAGHADAVNAEAGHAEAMHAASEHAPAAVSHPHPPGTPADHHAVTAPAPRPARPPTPVAPVAAPASPSATPARPAAAPTLPVPTPTPAEPVHDHSTHRH